MATPGGTKDTPNIDPPDDWELNHFLLEVSDMLDEEDLRKMKSLCSGKGGFGRGVLERLKSPLELFDLLQQTEKLTRHNLLYLQALIWSVGRKDIHKKFVAFGRDTKETLYFFAPKDTPDNGYVYLKFHVGGDTQNYSTTSLQKLQAHLARLLRVPAHFVFIGGIEPSSSLLITFMVPEDVVYVILELTEIEKMELLQYNIENVSVGDEIISLKGEPKSVYFLDVAAENRKLLEKESRHEKEIEALQIKLIEANKSLKERKHLQSQQRGVWMIWLAFLHTIYVATSRSRLSEKVPSCRTLAAQCLQRRMLRRSRELGYDETIISHLMDANATIVIEHVKIKEQVATTGLLQSMKTLQNENVILQYKLDKLLFYTRTKSGERILSEKEEYSLSRFLDGFPISITQISNPSTEVIVEEEMDKDFTAYVLSSLSNAMTTSEKKKIYDASSLTPDEMSFLHAYPDNFLMAVLSKESKGSSVDIYRWLINTLSPLGNHTLLQKGLDMLNEHVMGNTLGQHKGSPVGPDMKTTKGKRGKGASWDKSSEGGTHANSANKTEGSSNHEELKEQMERMMQMMSSVQKDIGVLKLKKDPYSPLSYQNMMNQDILTKSNGWN